MSDSCQYFPSRKLDMFLSACFVLLALGSSLGSPLDDDPSAGSGPKLQKRRLQRSVILESNSSRVLRSALSDDEARLVGGSPGVAITGSTYSWLVAVYNTKDSKVAGPGVVITANWFVCHTDVVGTLTNTDMIMYAGLDNPSTPSGRKYRVKDIKPYTPARDVLKNAITLVKFCPNFLGTAFTIPATTVTGALTPNADVTYANYAPAIQQVARKMGYLCQCDHYNTWDATQHFCLDEETTNFITTTGASPDLPGTICIYNNNFIGINVGTQDKGGEPYLEIAKFETWIRTTAV